jgi:Tfp pilus assembly protein FimT
MAASQRLAEDKQTGALELVLSTPTSVRSISNGLWLAYGRRMFFPALIAILVHCFFIWQIGIMAVLDPPSTKLPPGTTPGQLLWHALLNRPLGGVPLDWGFIVVSRIVLLALVLLMLVWLTLGWVGRWLGLRMKRPGFAPMTSLALVFLPPILLFSLACYCVSKWHLDRLPARLFAPLMMWVAVGIGAGHCLIVSLWAANRLRRDFRSVVTSHFQPAPVRPWWRPTRRSLLRIGAGGLATGAALLMIVLSFYGYQNWQSRRAWTAFQKELKQRNESLDVAVLLPGPVPENQNFALTPVFKSWVHSTEAHSAANQLFDHLTQLNASASQNGNGSAGTEWIRQMFAPLDDYSTWIAPGAGLPGNAKRAEFANAVLRGLKPYDATIRALASATRLPYFQTFTNRGVPTVLQPARNENGALAGLQMLLQARACALLANNRSAEAAEDLLAGLQLARLARQIPDAESPALTQTMLTRSLQPLWEGMVENRWTASQLAAFQAELSGFNLLVDYTNVVRRVVIANMVLWQEFAHRTSGPISFPAGDEYRTQVWEIQPRAWWLENCIELYRVGQNAIGRVDVAGVHIRNDTTYSDLSGLSLDYAASSLLQQAWWSGASPTLVVFAQTSVNQAIIACALERFRLATGKYPKTLEQLVPEYLPFVPNDVVRGRPMLYQNSSEGRFILRSVGPNGIDDRKFPISDDWLWSFPTNMVPAAATNRFQTK